MDEINIYKVVADKSEKLARRIPGFVFRYLRGILHEDEINRALRDHSHLEGTEFVKAALGDLDVTYNTVGMDKLDPAGRYVFASNHPFGGLDGLILAVEVEKKIGDVKVVVRDELMNIGPIKSLFIPVNKYGRQKNEGADAFNNAFASDVPIITFPAGLVSRRSKGVVRDLEWKSSFIKKAVTYQRDVVPVYFDGELSRFFYRLANIRKGLGVKVNIEMLYLVNEMFKQRGRHLEVIVGDPVDYRTLMDGRTSAEAAQYVKELVYSLRETAK